MKPMDAYTALCAFARAPHRRQDPWTPCAAIASIRVVYEVEMQDDRAWGPIFLRAMREGVIKRAGLFPRASSNGSVRPGWIGC